MPPTPFTISAMVFALGIGMLVAAEPPKEPTHDGKPLSEWIKSLSAEESARRSAWNALREMGGHSDAVIERLIATAADPGDKAANDATYILAGIGGPAVPALTQGLWSEDANRRKACLLAIRLIGPDALRAAPSVSRLLAEPDPDTRRNAAQTLAAMGAHSAVPALAKALDDRERRVQLAAALALIRLGAEPTNLIPVLTEVLASGVAGEADEAVRLLGLLGPEAARAAPALIERLGKAKAEEINRVVLTLGSIGPAAKDAVPALKALAADRGRLPSLRSDIGVALWLIARDPAGLNLLRENLTAGGTPDSNAQLLWRLDSGAESVAALETLLKSSEPFDAIAAASVLGARVKEAVTLLGKMLANKEPAVRARAVVALSRLGPTAKAVIEPLRATTKDEVPQIAFWATVALCKLEPKPDAVAVLTGFLNDRDVRVRRDAVEAIGLLGAGGKPAVASLTQRLDDAEEALRLATAVALWRIEKHPLALPALTKLLSSRDPLVREQAAVELGGTLGLDAMPAVPTLVKRLFDPSASVRSASAEALGRIGPAAADAVPALLALLEGDEPGFVLSAACEAVGLIAPADKDPATAVLKRKLENPDPLTRAHAALALWLVSGDRSGEKEAERGTAHRAYQVRITSAEALWQMKKDQRAVTLLVRALEESNLDGTQGENERYMAARALGRIGAGAKPAVPELLKLIHHHDAALAGAAAQALKAIDPGAVKKTEGK